MDWHIHDLTIGAKFAAETWATVTENECAALSGFKSSLTSYCPAKYII